MFANRFTALVDACVLAGVLKRDLILSLAEAEFFRVRWSNRILDEAEAAIHGIRVRKGYSDDKAKIDAKHSRLMMQKAFEDSLVEDFDNLISIADLPDPNDLHVIAAAVKTQAAVIVTDNLRHFPEHILRRFNLLAKTADDFIADTVDLDLPRALTAIERMRLRSKKPELTPEALLLRLEDVGLTATADLLRPSLSAYGA
ncbi:PIN domain-containing protein [Acidisoma sp.]|uniref:PIN domain-containing protein n=1 Tax=Acidisoma sp. TaxID=1872115 RepID=UPI003B0077FD